MEAWGSIVDCDNKQQFQDRVLALKLFVLHSSYLLIM